MCFALGWAQSHSCCGGTDCGLHLGSDMALLLGLPSHAGPKPLEQAFCSLSCELDLCLGKHLSSFPNTVGNSCQSLLNVGQHWCPLICVRWSEFPSESSPFSDLISSPVGVPGGPEMSRFP